MHEHFYENLKLKKRIAELEAQRADMPQIIDEMAQRDRRIAELERQINLCSGSCSLPEGGE